MVEFRRAFLVFAFVWHDATNSRRRSGRLIVCRSAQARSRVCLSRGSDAGASFRYVICDPNASTVYQLVHVSPAVRS
jgi:hypothetical protein